ncbi:hypothetical protein TYRP_022773, partial [Tyrophagus putrescentiae]
DQSSKLSLVALVATVLAATLNIEPVQSTSSPKTVCYYEYWVHWRTGDGKQDPSEIDYTLCTHIVYSYMGIDGGTHEIKLLDPYLMNDLHDIDKFAKAKGNSKALVSVGGAAASSQFSITVSVDSYRTAFVNSVVSFISSHNFDGVILDWSGMTASDNAHFIALLDKFDEKLANTPYTLAVTVPASLNTAAYNVPKIAQYVDFINVIAHDYAGPWSKQVGHASLLSHALSTMEAYHKAGAPRSKLVMSVPAFARTWRLANPAKQDIGDEALGGGEKGPYTQVEGLLSYNELCVLMRAHVSQFSLVRDPAEHAVYAVYLRDSGHAEWLSFEDSKSLAFKADNVTRSGYAGLSVYSISNEDVHGVCGQKNPLLHAINAHYWRGAVTEGPTPPNHFTPGPTEAPGKFRDPVYCFKYYDCEKGEFGGFESTVFYCERHQAWDEHAQKCVDAKTVPGC